MNKMKLKKKLLEREYWEVPKTFKGKKRFGLGKAEVGGAPPFCTLEKMRKGELFYFCETTSQRYGHAIHECTIDQVGQLWESPPGQQMPKPHEENLGPLMFLGYAYRVSPHVYTLPQDDGTHRAIVHYIWFMYSGGFASYLVYLPGHQTILDCIERVEEYDEKWVAKYRSLVIPGNNGPITKDEKLAKTKNEAFIRGMRNHY